MEQLDENHGSPWVVNSTSPLRDPVDSLQYNVSVPNPPIFESQANQDTIFPSSTPEDSLPNMEGLSTQLENN